MASSDMSVRCILLVEDDRVLGDGILAGLRMADYDVDWVRDGEAADSALVNHRYDVCLLDLSLPKRDGLSVLSDLRKRGDLIPVLIMTARASAADKESYITNGANDLLSKPFDLEELFVRIRALLSHQSRPH